MKQEKRYKISKITNMGNQFTGVEFNEIEFNNLVEVLTFSNTIHIIWYREKESGEIKRKIVARKEK